MDFQRERNNNYQGNGYQNRQYVPRQRPFQQQNDGRSLRDINLHLKGGQEQQQQQQPRRFYNEQRPTYHSTYQYQSRISNYCEIIQAYTASLYRVKALKDDALYGVLKETLELANKKIVDELNFTPKKNYRDFNQKPTQDKDYQDKEGMLDEVSITDVPEITVPEANEEA